jgi:hypothetical protein
VNGGPVSNRSNDLIVMIVRLQKTTDNKTCFIALNRAIRVGLDLIYPLARDQKSRRVINKTPSVNTLKSSNLLRISNITIGGRLGKRDNKA